MAKREEQHSTVLDKAKVIVYGRGERDYGHPRVNMGNTAEFWTSYLQRRGLLGNNSITPRDVALMMVMVKVSREAQEFRVDNLIDIAGYTEVANRITTGR